MRRHAGDSNADSLVARNAALACERTHLRDEAPTHTQLAIMDSRPICDGSSPDLGFAIPAAADGKRNIRAAQNGSEFGNRKFQVDLGGRAAETARIPLHTGERYESRLPHRSRGVLDGEFPLCGRAERRV